MTDADDAPILDGIAASKEASTEAEGSAIAAIVASKYGATPVPPRNASDATSARPLVTVEKKANAGADASNSDAANDASVGPLNDCAFSVSCPDGSIVDLSAAPADEGGDADATISRIVLGRGRFGIPTSAAHVSRRACVLRIADRNIREGNGTSRANSSHCNGHDDGSYFLELVVLGSQPCRVTRPSQSSDSVFVKNISQILASEDDLSPSSAVVYDGDVIEPYERPMDCTVDEAKARGCYHPFKVRIAKNTNSHEGFVGERIDGSAFLEASRKIDMAAHQQKKDIEDSEETAATANIETHSVAKGAADGNEDNAVSNDKVAGETVDSSARTTTANVESGELTRFGPTSEKGEGNADEEMKDSAAASTPVSESDKPNIEMSGSENATEVPADGNSPCHDAIVESNESSQPLDTNLSDNIDAKFAKGSRSEVLEKDESSPSSAESSEEEYDIDDPRQEIIDTLQGIESPGSFAVGGSCDGKLVMPGLVVDGVGSVGLPLSRPQAKELAERCERAPFGRGSETMVDLSVRNTFQLAPGHFSIMNPSWKRELDGLTASVCESLGVQSDLAVEARLYKLLLYEEGSFFAPHRDSEKEDGMFGTLVIVLPSQFSGGDLVVKHKRETETFKQAGSNFVSQYISFYADCKHELKKVTSGHRLCLVYNLVKTGFGVRPRAADNGSLVKMLTRAASAWGKQYDGHKLVLMTEHLYTPAGIKNGKGSSKYKGDDAAVVELLERAIEEGADIEYDHGTVSLSESGYAEEDGDGWGYRYDRSYSWVEATDRNLSLKLSSYGSVCVSEEEEMHPENYFEDKDPDDETFEPTGNEGVHAERQYADAEAIVVWPRSQRWVIVTNNNTSRMCQYLAKACTEGSSDTEPKEECIKKAKTLISRDMSSSDLKTMMKCILMIGDVPLAENFLSSHLSGSPNAILEHIQDFIDHFGADTINPFFVSSINANRFGADPTGLANFLLKILDQQPSNQHHTKTLIEAFVDSMCPSDGKERLLRRRPDNFPLDSILSLFVDKGNNSLECRTLARRVLESYVGLSCQDVRDSYSSWRTITKKPMGPELLTYAISPLLNLCKTFGWIEYEDMLVDAVEKLCLHGNANCALDLVERIAPNTALSGDSDESDQSRICARMATTACEKILGGSEPSSANRSAVSLTTCKALVKIIAKFCPEKASRFVEVAKLLDVDSIVYPLVTDVTLRSTAGNDMQISLESLTLHCAHILQSRIPTHPGSVSTWILPNANLSRNSAYSSFLQNPCQKSYSWKVRKCDHSHFLTDLSPLIRLGEVKAGSHQPRGRGPWHFYITKLKPHLVSLSILNTLTCSCSSSGSRYSTYSSFDQAASSCVLKSKKAKASKFCDDSQKLNMIRAMLPPPPPPPPPQMRQQILNVVYTTPSLGLSLTLINKKRIIVAGISPGAPNAHVVKVNDALVGINGDRFDGALSFQDALARVKETQRPLSVMFERCVAVTNSVDKRPSSASAPSGLIGQTSASGSSQHAAKKQKTSEAEVINLLDDDDDVQIEGALAPAQAVAKRVKEAKEKGEVVMIS